MVNTQKCGIFVVVKVVSKCLNLVNYVSRVYINIQTTISVDTKLQDKNRPNTVGLGSRIQRLHLCRGVKPHLKEFPRYDTKQSDCDTSVLDIRGMWSTRSFLLLPDQLYIGWIELLDI